jgi:CheY-like chemotaxis protein/chitodextrinase
MTKKVSLLLVEDDQVVREAMAQLLEGEGYAVRSASNCDEALEIFKREEIELVLLDLNLGDQDGWQLFETLKEFRRELPIIVTSGESHRFAHVSASAASAILEKPLDLSALLSSLRHALLARPLQAAVPRGVLSAALTLLAFCFPMLAQAADFKINTLEPRDGNIVVTWQGGGSTNQLQFRPTLNSPWEDIDIPTAASAGTNIMIHPTGFYQILDLQEYMATAADRKAPSTPTGVLASSANCNQVNLSWNASSDSGQNASGVKGYNIYRNGVFLKQVLAPETTTSDTGLLASTSYGYHIIAVDKSRNVSPKSVTVYTTTPACSGGGGNQAPYAQAGSDQSAAPGSIVWFADGGSFDPDGILTSFYWDFGDGTSASGQTVWHVYGAGGVYPVRLTVWDNLGASSSDTLYVTVAAPTDGTPPSTTLTSPVNGSYVSGTISLVASATDNPDGSGVARVEFYRDNGILLGTVWSAPYVVSLDTMGLGNGAHTLYTRAYDAVGNVANSVDVTVTVNNNVSTPGQFKWATKLGGVSGLDTAMAHAVKTDSQGNIIVVGRFGGNVDFGGITLSSSGSTTEDIFVAKYSGQGQLQWVKRFGTAYSDWGMGVTTDSANNIIMTGYFYSTIDFGGGTLTSVGARDLFVAKFSANGTHVWSKRFGGSGDDYGHAVAVDASDNVVMTGGFSGTVDFGGGLLTSVGVLDVFVAKYNAGGAHLWSRRYGGAGSDIGRGVAVDSRGNILVTGSFYNSVSFGGTTFSTGGVDGFVVKYTGDGNHVWSRSLGAVSALSYAVATDSSDNVVITGAAGSDVDFGAGLLPTTTSAAIFVAKYSSAGGYVWAKRFGGELYGSDSGYGLAIDGAGNIAVTGVALGAISFGGEKLYSSGSRDMVVARLNAGGDHIWSKRFKDTYSGAGLGVAYDGQGNVIAVGGFGGTVDFEGRAFDSGSSSQNGVVAVYGP